MFSLVLPIQLARDYVGRMDRYKEIYEARSMRITKEFVDHDEELAGFAWEKKELI